MNRWKLAFLAAVLFTDPCCVDTDETDCTPPGEAPLVIPVGATATTVEISPVDWERLQEWQARAEWYFHECR